MHTTVNMEDCEPGPTTKIRTGVDWRAPLGSSKQRWRNTLEKAWEEGGSKNIVQVGDVEKDWATFLEHVDAMHRRAVQQVLRIERQT